MNVVEELMERMWGMGYASLLRGGSSGLVKAVYKGSHNPVSYLFPITDLIYICKGEVKDEYMWNTDWTVLEKRGLDSNIDGEVMEFSGQDHTLMLWRDSDPDKSLFCMNDIIISVEDYENLDMMVMIYPELAELLRVVGISWEVFVAYLSPVTVIRQKALDTLDTGMLDEYATYINSEEGKLNEVNRLEDWSAMIDRVDEEWQ